MALIFGRMYLTFMEVGKFYYKIIFSYDGTLFNGYAKQTNKRTIQDEIEKALETMFQEKIILRASGRTDSGVHALNQVADFSSNKKIPVLKKFVSSLNKLLPLDIYIKEIEEVDENFSSRFCAKEKIYLYKINYFEYDPLNRNYEVFMKNIDINLFIEASKHFIGKHNFQNFTSKISDDWGFIRTIYDINVRDDGTHLLVEIRGDGFMKYEVRKIVGTLLQISRHRLPIEYIDINLSSKKRDIVNFTAHSEGLYLKEVKY